MNLIKELNILIKKLEYDYVNDAIKVEWRYEPSTQVACIIVNHPLYEADLLNTLILNSLEDKDIENSLKLLDTMMGLELDKVNKKITKNYT